MFHWRPISAEEACHVGLCRDRSAGTTEDASGAGWRSPIRRPLACGSAKRLQQIGFAGRRRPRNKLQHAMMHTEDAREATRAVVQSAPVFMGAETNGRWNRTASYAARRTETSPS
jgi:hypothetical protein